MLRPTIHRCLLGLTLAALLLAPAAGAERLAQVVDSEGTLLTLVSGSYGELFPDGLETSRDAQVLALDVAFEGHTSDQGALRAPERLLVPTTASQWPESSATLFYDAGAGNTFLLWSAPFNGLHPMLYLTTFDGSGWGEVFEIVGTIFAPKMDLQLAVGHDSHGFEDGRKIRRTVVHVAWWEPRASGIEKQYAALVLENGAYVGRTLSQDLSNFLETESVDMISEESSPLADALVLQAGPNESMIAGYHDSRTGQLSSLQIEVLPMALSILAQRVEDAAQTWDPASGTDLMATINKALAEHGSAFHPAVLGLLASEVRGMIEAAQGEDGGVHSIIEKFGPRIIHIGMRVGSNGLVNPDAVGLLTITPEVGEFASPRHDLKISTLGRWSTPEDVGANPLLMLSRDGSDALIAWRGEESNVLYRETTADGSWSDIRGLELSDELSYEAALLALADHVRER